LTAGQITKRVNHVPAGHVEHRHIHALPCGSKFSKNQGESIAARGESDLNFAYVVNGRGGYGLGRLGNAATDQQDERERERQALNENERLTMMSAIYRFNLFGVNGLCVNILLFYCYYSVTDVARTIQAAERIGFFLASPAPAASE